MKKIDYIAPEQEVIVLKCQQILAASAGSETSGGTDEAEGFALESDFEFKED